MNKTVVLKEETRNRIRKLFPNFDLSRPLTRSDWTALRKVLAQKEYEDKKEREKEKEEKKKGQRLALIREKGIVPGCLVKNPEGERHLVKKITSDARLILEGVQGSFHPIGWERV